MLSHEEHSLYTFCAVTMLFTPIANTFKLEQVFRNQKPTQTSAVQGSSVPLKPGITDILLSFIENWGDSGNPRVLLQSGLKMLLKWLWFFEKRTNSLCDFINVVISHPSLISRHSTVDFFLFTVSTVCFVFRSDWLEMSFFRIKKCLWWCVLDVSLLAFSRMRVWFADIQHLQAALMLSACVRSAVCVWSELLFLLLRCKLLCNISADCWCMSL